VHGLSDDVELKLIDTPRARATTRTHEDRGMMIRALYPVKDANNEVIAILDGGVLLNGNYAFVDTIRDLVYGKGSLMEGSIGTVTVFLDDVRINTNVPIKENQRALGTRVSDEVRTKVLDKGETWIDRAFAVNDWYISSYEPIIDVDGDRVGMLYAGYLEAPYRAAMWQAYIGLLLVFLLLMVLSAIVSIRGAKSIFKPVESMSAVVQQTSKGDTGARIGEVESRDELGDLARGFDEMLDQLQHRSEEIQKWADQLEDKVSERTRELMKKNEDLSRTIILLKKTHQQLVAADKLAALGQLTAGVAHEINNPTQVILGNLDVVIQEMGGQLDPVREEIDLVIRQVYRIQEILNNLLQYSRPGEYTTGMQTVDVNGVIENTLQLVHHLGKERHFDLRVRPTATIGIQINAQELQQVMVNLISNAVQALPRSGGFIEIVTADWEQHGVTIQVIDNGQGIASKDMGNIFNPFFSTKQQGEGTGLGLSVSYGLVRKYGGDITVSTTPEQHTEFTVWLEAKPEFTEDLQALDEGLAEIEHSTEEWELAAGDS
jgi:two-component system NtrC family sensor kinase